MARAFGPGEGGQTTMARYIASAAPDPHIGRHAIPAPIPIAAACSTHTGA